MSVAKKEKYNIIISDNEIGFVIKQMDLNRNIRYENISRKNINMILLYK